MKVLPLVCRGTIQTGRCGLTLEEHDSLDADSRFPRRQDFVRSYIDLERAYESTLEGWIRALDLRDRETEGHSRRVCELTVALAGLFGIKGDQLVHVRRGALLHDIGKMALPDRILLKPGPLDEAETMEMQRHPQHAHDMLSPIEFLSGSLDIPFCHHEHWDGTGYPRGLKKEDIPFPARLFSVIDVWDALRYDRPYRKGWPVDRVIEHIRSLSGIQFEPVVVDAFEKLLLNRGDL